MNKRSAWILVVLMTAAFLLRFAGLGSNPPGFFRDEADKGYTSWCLLHTGQDQAGNPWPLFVPAMNVTTSALYQYLDIPFVAVFGLNEWAIRLPACLAGTLSTFAAFLLARALWGTAAGLWAGLFVCLSPWSLLLSRWANQSILLTVSIPLGLFFFLRQRERLFPSASQALLSALFFLIAIYTYAPARLYIPVFVALLWFVSFTREALSPECRKEFLLSLGIFVAVFALGCIPLARHVLLESAQSAARLSRITIFDGQPLSSALLEWMGNYCLHFSPWFLWIRGDENLRHSTYWFGQLHLYLFPLVILGVLQAVKRRSRIDRILLLWLFCFPIAAACTRERVPHALRSVFAVPAFQIVAVYGIVSWNEWIPNLKAWFFGQMVKGFVRLWLVLLVLCPILYLGDLFVFYPRYAAVEWEYGYREAVSWWNIHRNGADRTQVSGMAEYPYVFFLFFGQYPPERWIAERRIEGVEFVPTGQSTQSVLGPEAGRVLYLLREEEILAAFPETTIRLPSGETIWKWVAWGNKKE